MKELRKNDPIKFPIHFKIHTDIYGYPVHTGACINRNHGNPQ